MPKENFLGALEIWSFEEATTLHGADRYGLFVRICR